MYKLEKICKLLFNTFFTNDTAIAVQTNTGYKTIKTDVTPEIIEYMLRSKASVAAYQQATYKDTLRWICFDFDCVSEDMVHLLFDTVVRPFIANLSSISIPFIVEFSGRRGFHVWIILDRMISKSDGYILLSAIENKCLPFMEDSTALYNLDRFPATGAGHNKYGKAVKIPMSFHKKGQYSQMLSPEADYQFLPVESLDDEFIDSQTSILEQYRYANYTKLKNALGLEASQYTFDPLPKFEYVNSPITLPAFLLAVKGSSVLELLVRHMQTDSLTHLDRSILVGLFSHVSGGEQLLHFIMQTQSNYNPVTTDTVIKRMQAYYYSLSFGQLYSYYHADLEPEIDSRASVIEWLLDKMGIDHDAIPVVSPKEKRHATLEDIVRKEQNYQLFNDEVIDVLTLRDMQQLTALDLAYISSWIENIENGDLTIPLKISYQTHMRIESETKDRTLFSLSAFDRVFTTMLAFRFSELYSGSWESYSYHINSMPGGDVFYPWLTSWNRYQRNISTYLNIPLFYDFHLIKIDIRHFYDTIRFHSIFDKCMETIRQKASGGNSEKACNIFRFLVNYNSNLMMLEKKDHGVPQGPAYARVLAEFFLSVVIQLFHSMIGDQFGKLKLFRYVDDIFVFLEPSADPQNFLHLFSQHVEKCSLFLNKEKTGIWGRIKDIDPKSINDLLAKSEENYKIQGFSNLEYYEDEDLLDPITTFNNYLMRDGKWNIGDANFLLNVAIDPFLSNMYLREYRRQIIASEIGRGSIFRKFYGMLFKDPNMSKPFFEKQEYSQIPVPSLNMSNMISTLYLLLKQNGELSSIDKASIITMCVYLREKNLLPSDRSSVNAILAFLQSRN